MNTPTAENIATVIDGLEEFFVHMTKTQSFNLQEFVKFMEPKFKAAGYRDTDRSIRGGNILILSEIGAGDFIVTTGAIREIRRLYPTAHITLVIHPHALELAEYCPYVDEMILNPQEFRNDNLFDNYKMNLRVAPALLEQRFDVCFAFSINVHTPLLMYMSGAKIRIIPINHETWTTFNNSNGAIEVLTKLGTHLFPYNAYGYHRSDRFFSLIENLLHLPVTNRNLELWCTSDDVEVAKSYLIGASSTIYSLCMGGSHRGSLKHYPPEKYARLLEMILHEEPAVTFVVLGGGQKDLKSAAILKSVIPKIYANNVIDLTNKTTYRQSGAVLNFCDMYIGNDTGTMHLVAAVNCPVLTPNCFPADLPIRNTDTPRRWYPYGVPSVIVQPAHALPECKNPQYYDHFGCKANFAHCITQIEPQTLFRGFHLLKERIAAGINEPLYIH